MQAQSYFDHMTGEGAFFNVDHFLVLRKERHERQKNQDNVNDSKHKELFTDLDGTNPRLILRAKHTGA